MTQQFTVLLAVFVFRTLFLSLITRIFNEEVIQMILYTVSLCIYKKLCFDKKVVKLTILSNGFQFACRVRYEN
jgi:hypothetical protein